VQVLTDAHELKFELLAKGLSITKAAGRFLSEVNEHRPLTPADYASTSGVILELEDDVWVNAPIADYNPNFVNQPPYVLDLDKGGLVVHGRGLTSTARFWLPPRYHGQLASDGKPYNYYAFTHGDRVRLSPIMGCAMVCKFCNIPYEDRYGIKPLEVIAETLGVAMGDPYQPAQHVLISGGTPHDRDIPFLRSVYDTVLARFPETEIDIMMVPIEGLLDLPRLDELGVHQLSINIELFGSDLARRLMRQKFGRGLDWYLDFLERGAEVLGPGRIRSMLLVGLEPLEDTLRGVEAIVDRGCVPVLSPFRPSPGTPLEDYPPPTADEMKRAYLEAAALAADAGIDLGPDCPPCSHNTLTFPRNGYRHERPRMV